MKFLKKKMLFNLVLWNDTDEVFAPMHSGTMNCTNCTKLMCTRVLQCIGKHLPKSRVSDPLRSWPKRQYIIMLDIDYAISWEYSILHLVTSCFDQSKTINRNNIIMAALMNKIKFVEKIDSLGLNTDSSNSNTFTMY